MPLPLNVIGELHNDSQPCSSPNFSRFMLGKEAFLGGIVNPLNLKPLIITRGREHRGFAGNHGHQSSGR